MRCFMSNEECEHYPPRKDISRDVFVISPFGYPFDEVFENMIKRSSELDFNLRFSRADLALQLGYVMCQRICRKIIESEYVIADVSLPNPNVYYEAGLSYSLNKKIIFIANEKLKNDYRFKFSNDCAHYIPYNGITDLKISKKSCTQKKSGKGARQNCLELAVQDPCSLGDKLFFKMRDRMNYFEHKRIAIFENANAPLTDLHKITLEEIQNSKYKELSIPQNKPSDGSQRIKNFLENFKSWKIKETKIDHGLKLNDFIKPIKNSNICVIDTTQYKDKVNPYIFFCLGLAHGFEREVIPITNRQVQTDHPFDTRGLWHIFYQNKLELKEQFLQIVPSIFEELDSAKNSNLVKQLWNPFLEDKNIRIFTCARNVDASGRDGIQKKSRIKGKRTNVDKCDYKTVTELAFFIVQNYPTAEVNFSEPQSKKNKSEIKHLEKSGKLKTFVSEIEDKIEKYGDCIIVGSADVNDYSEVSLAAIHNISSYKYFKKKVALKKVHETLKKKAFIFGKGAANKEDPKHTSTFYEVGNTNSIHWYGDTYGCSEPIVGKKARGTTYGVLTIADNPFCKNKKTSPPKIMVLSGFTGIATYGISQLLTSKKLREELMNPLVVDHEVNKRSKVNVLIQIDYKIDNRKIPGDTRTIKDIQLMDVQDCPDLSKFF